MKDTGIEFLNKIYKDLHLKEEVMHTALPSDNKNEKVEKYIKRIEDITSRAVDRDKLSLLKKYYYDKYVIKKENAPQSYFKLQERIALNRGYGHLEYDDELKEQEIDTIINEQKSSLDRWLDYFVSEETSYYPTWFKYYVFQGMLGLGEYDKAKRSFSKRTDSTAKPFIEINREAVAMLYSELIKVLNKEQLDDIELQKLLNGGSFQRVYSYIINKLDMVYKDTTNSEEGIWKKYNKGSNPEILFNDIYGKGTGWCTAGGIETATQHINGGDFHVYYTKDKDGNFTVPRIAIRMENNKIAEIRGVAENQNIESNMEKVVKQKLNEFPDKEEYIKKVKDMEMLTYIYTKWENKIELKKDDLRFLYELDEKIVGFGYQKDPRIEEITNTRNIRTDLAYIFDCKKENISLTKDEALRGNIVYHYGNLDLRNLTSAKGLELPKVIWGHLNLRNLTSAEGLILPEIINGNLDLSSLISAKDLIFPKEINGYLDLSSLTSTEGLILPEIINRYLDLSSLISAKGLKLPKELGEGLYLNSLTSVEGLVLPDKINGDLALSSLTSAEDLIFSKEISGSLYLTNLTSADGLKLPEIIGRTLYLGSLTSAKDLILPKTINGHLDLGSLTNVEGLIFPEKIGGYLHLESLTSAKGLVLPDDFDLKRLFCCDDEVKEEIRLRLILQKKQHEKCKKHIKNT